MNIQVTKEGKIAFQVELNDDEKFGKLEFIGALVEFLKNYK